ncbi:HAD-like domain-containing protein [Microdochium bolleyi]|uniref:HAD-like domain-containing protein n=1 Tax=Microdochium bolleyi TaxID=196109 RepID=A0A136IVU7_9PEZI|nr:HAD-like domain-containing protein [Microdochium bolleyi]
MAPRTDFPPVRACLFDMDGLLLDTEDIYTECINILLAKYNRPNLPWSIKAQLQGRPGPEANAIFHQWADLPIEQSDYLTQYSALQAEHFPHAKPLPGVEKLLADLHRTRFWDLPASTSAAMGASKQQHRVHIALATSSNSANFAVKTTNWADLFSVFPPHRRVLGDDKRITPGRGKPLPDIYLLALDTINASLPAGEKPIAPEECLVFEDSVPGVEAGRRAGMRVAWVPHPMLKKEYEGRDKDILAGRMGAAGVDVDTHQLGEHDDGWADYMLDLTDFPYEKYGIVVPPKEVDEDPAMKDKSVGESGAVAAEAV